VIASAHNRSGTPVAIVTGGSQGVGRAVARKLASGNYAVVVGYLNSQSAAEAAVAEILAANGTAVAVRASSRTRSMSSAYSWRRLTRSGASTSSYTPPRG
jgi:NAD(P)-dependent dehydrogenase (short-subunit alcohol dehydrogenase family)